MNKENAKDFLPFVQALAQGKTIQYRASYGKSWVDMENLAFCGKPSSYRIKPEPLTMEVWVSKNEQVITNTDMSEYVQNWRKGTATITFE